MRRLLHIAFYISTPKKHIFNYKPKAVHKEYDQYESGEFFIIYIT